MVLTVFIQRNENKFLFIASIEWETENTVVGIITVEKEDKKNYNIII